MNKETLLLLLSLLLFVSTQRVRSQETLRSSNLSAFAPTGPTDELGDLYRAALKARKAQAYDEANDLYRQLLSKAMQVDDQFMLVKTHYALARSLSITQNYPESLKHFLAVLKFPKPYLSDKRYARCLSKIASIYQTIGDYDAALDYQYQALTTQEKMQDSTGIMQTYYTLGNILFYYKNQYKEAAQSYQKTYTLARTLNKPIPTVIAMCALGSCFEKQGQLEQAEQINFEAYLLADSTNDVRGQISALQNIGTTFSEKGSYQMAAQFLQQSIELANRNQFPWGTMVGKKHLGLVCKKQGNYRLAKEYLGQGLLIADSIQDVHQQMELHIALSAVYEEEGKKSIAFDHLKQYQEIEASIYDENMIDEIYALEYNEEIQKQEEQIRSSELKIQLLEQQAANRKIKIILLYGSFFALLLVAGLIGYYYWRKREMYIVLENTYSLLEDKNQQIEKTNQQLAEANSDLKQFTYAASHDLKAPLRTIHSFTTLLRRKTKSHLDEDSREYFDFILGAAGRMQTLLQDLLNYAKLGAEKIPEKTVDLNEVVDASLFNLQEAILKTNAQIQLPKSRLPKITGHESQLIQVFQNLIGNALKFHGPEIPAVRISCQTNDNFHTVSIQDNGIGIASENLEQIFNMFTRLHESSQFEGTGIGLATCKKIIERHGGRIWVSSTSGEGSIFYFTLPVSNLRPLHKNQGSNTISASSDHIKFQIQGNKY